MATTTNGSQDEGKREEAPAKIPVLADNVQFCTWNTHLCEDHPQTMPSLKKEIDRLCEYMYGTDTLPYSTPFDVASCSAPVASKRYDRVYVARSNAAPQCKKICVVSAETLDMGHVSDHRAVHAVVELIV